MIEEAAPREVFEDPAVEITRPKAWRPTHEAEDEVLYPTISGIWPDDVRYDLASSDSETLSLASLLALARADDLERWEGLGLGYTEPRGERRLREAIARRHVSMNRDAVVVCAGAQEALTCVAHALLAPDDHAVVVLPIYRPSERAVTRICETTGVPLADEAGWRLDVDRVAAALRPNTKLVLANFPNSPTGATLDAAELDGLVALSRRNGLWLVNDEVYRQTDSPRSGCLPMVADVYERGISINGLSKGFGLPGLRVGWVACRHQAIVSGVLSAKSALSTCVAATSEVLGTIALREEATIVERTRAIGQANRDRLTAMLECLPDLFEIDTSRNLAFAFPRYRGSEGPDRLSMELMRRVGLHLLPASLWSSPLAAMPTDFVRIGLGHAKNGTALGVLGSYLSGRGS